MAEPELPLSVWPVAQGSARAQRAGRYLPVSFAHPAKMLPSLARTAIAAYSQPGEVVVDPMCGIGTTLVEAAHLGRQAIGVEYEPRWAELARANLAYARARGATGHARVITGDARHLVDLVDPALHSQVALVLTSPPYGGSTHGHVTTGPNRVHKWNFRYSTDPANLAHAGLASLMQALGEILAACARILRPGGLIVLTARPWRRQGALVDLPGQLVRLGEAFGLVLFERNVALLAGVRDEGLVPRTTFFQLEHTRAARRRGRRQLVIAHEDVLVFRARP